MRIIRGIFLIAVVLGAAAADEAANAWLKEPTNRGDDPVRAEIRAVRDKIYEDLFERNEILSPDMKTHTTVSEGSIFNEQGSWYRNNPEIPVDRGLVFVTGRFDHHRAILTHGQHAIYSEILVGVDQVIWPAEAKLKPGDTVTLLQGGGTIKNPDGRLIEFLTDPRKYSMKPSHRYILALKYQENGDYFLVFRSWEITDGVVRPDSWIEEGRVREGLSMLNGLYTETAAHYIRNYLDEHRALGK